MFKVKRTSVKQYLWLRNKMTRGSQHRPAEEGATPSSLARLAELATHRSFGTGQLFLAPTFSPVMRANQNGMLMVSCRAPHARTLGAVPRPLRFGPRRNAFQLPAASAGTLKESVSSSVP